MRVTYNIKLYNSSKNYTLYGTIDTCGEIWNYCIAYIREHYKVHQKLCSKNDLQKHLTLIKKEDEYAHWNTVGSQAIQEITDRIYRSYRQFFKKCNKGKKASPNLEKSGSTNLIPLSKQDTSFLKTTTINFNQELFDAIASGKSLKTIEELITANFFLLMVLMPLLEI